MSTTDTEFAALAEVEAIRARIDHPVIDGDGHLIEHARCCSTSWQRKPGRKTPLAS